MGIRVAAYCRVSTDSTDQENSFENQKSLFERIIRERGNELVGIYSDRGVSGTKLSRPGFDRMLTDAGLDVIKVPKGSVLNEKEHIVYEVSAVRKPLFQEIWMKNTSRFARNVSSHELIEKLKEAGVYLYFYEQNLNTRDPSTTTFLELMAAMDEQESRAKSIRVLTGKAESRKRGSLASNGKIYGYRYHTGKKKGRESYLEPIPEEAKTVKRIFEMYADGAGIRTIVRTLEENKIFTRNGKPFGKTTIRNILRNEKYFGCNNANKYDVGVIFHRHFPRIRETKEYDPENISDRISPIITKELFDRCQEMLNSKVNHRINVGINSGKTEYAGKLICGKCGSKYIGNTDRGKHFYNCSGKKTKGIAFCNGKNVYPAELDELFAHVNDRAVNERMWSQAITISLGFLFVKIECTMCFLDNDAEAAAREAKAKIADYQEQLDQQSEIIRMSRSATSIKKAKEKYEELSEAQAKEEERFRESSDGNRAIIERIMDLYRLFEEIQTLDVKTLSETTIKPRDIAGIVVDCTDDIGSTPLSPIPFVFHLKNGRRFQVHYSAFERITKVVGKDWLSPIQPGDMGLAYRHSGLAEMGTPGSHDPVFLIISSVHYEALKRDYEHVRKRWEELEEE